MVYRSRKNIVCISKDALSDRRLSLASKGLLAILLMIADEGEDIIHIPCTDGLESINDAMTELCKYGHVTDKGSVTYIED